MIRLIFNYLDKILFALAAILGLQLPAFIQQYSQRVGGHLNEALGHLDRYRLLAAKNYDGNIQQLIAHLKNNPSEKLSSVGTLVEDLSARTEHLQASYNSLQQSNFLKRVFSFVRDLDLDIAKATLEQYQWSIPLTTDAALCAIITATTITALFSLLGFLGRKLIIPSEDEYFDDNSDYDWYSPEPSPQKKHSKANRDREPSFNDF